jgi:isoprenylcysteine carboxyl methyltransferase (ICMT) family protein YpbQ
MSHVSMHVAAIVNVSMAETNFLSAMSLKALAIAFFVKIEFRSMVISTLGSILTVLVSDCDEISDLNRFQTGLQVD